MRSDVDLTNFTSGQLSPRMKGRIDHKSYFNGCEVCQNFIVMPQGGVTARPGTQFVALNKSQTSRARLIPFIFSTIQAYMLSFSDLNVRVYMNDGTVLSGGSPVDIAVPYRTADLLQIKFTQSADTLFLVHPKYPPAQLTRSSHTAWSYSTLSFKDGPFLDINTTSNNVTPSGSSGSITLTWDSTTNINGGAGFTSADIGRSVRVRLYTNWGWCTITGINSPTQVVATVNGVVNNGSQNGLDGMQWTPSTRYDTGAVISQATAQPGGTSYYIAVSGGVSAASGTGPVGLGSAILDGSVIWTAAGNRDASRLQRTTVYNVNDIVQSPTNDFFQAIIGGKTDSSTGAIPTAGVAGAQVDGTVQWVYLPPFTFPGKTKNWSLSQWGGTNGYPFTVGFWQERLCFGGFPAFPNRIVGSASGDFTNFAPSRADGTVLDSNAIDWTIDDSQVNAITWLINAGSAQQPQFGIGTYSAEHTLQAATNAQALTPHSVQSFQETTYGSGPYPNPVRIGKAVLFVDRTGRKLREWAFYWQQSGYVGPDKLSLSENISRAAEGLPNSSSGIGDIVYQQSPYQLIWAWRNDGALLSFTYDFNEQVFAPAFHVLGGQYAGDNPIVESLGVIPSPDGTYDELWLSVVRTAPGNVTTPIRTIEVLTRFYDARLPDEAFFVDCGLASTQTAGVGNLYFVTPTLLTPPTQPPKWGGDFIELYSDGSNAWNVGDVIRANGGKLIVTTVTNSNYCGVQTIVPLKSIAPVRGGGWSYQTPAQSFSGLTHLANQQVWLWGDGADLGFATVSGGGVVTVPDAKVSYLTAGLLAAPILVTMPWEPVRAAGAATAGKMKDIDRLYTRFLETRGARYGRRTTDQMTREREDKLTPMEDRGGADLMDNAPPLNSGMYILEPTQDYDLEGQIIFTRDGAGPMTIVGVFASGQVAEMPAP